MNLRDLFKNTEHVETIAAGATIFTEGSPGHVMYVVLDGEVEIWIGRELIDVARPGDLVGEMALIDATARSATARATAPCRLAPIDEERFLFLVQQTPYFSLHVMRILASRLRRMNARQGADNG